MPSHIWGAMALFPVFIRSIDSVLPDSDTALTDKDLGFSMNSEFDSLWTGMGVAKEVVPGQVPRAKVLRLDYNYLSHIC